MKYYNFSQLHFSGSSLSSSLSLRSARNPSSEPFPSRSFRLLAGVTSNADARDSGSVVCDNDVQYQVCEQTRLAKEMQQKARLEITEYALKREDSRLERARRKSDEDLDAEIDFALYQAKRLHIDYCTAIGYDRPLSGCSFSSDGTILATCYLSGVAKLWSMPQMTKISTQRDHTERETDVAFSPTDNNNILATASADRTARIWNSRGDFLRTFEGHLGRLARIAFHPSGKVSWHD